MKFDPRVNLDATTALTPETKKAIKQPALLSTPATLLLLAACNGDGASPLSISNPIGTTSYNDAVGTSDDDLFGTDEADKIVGGAGKDILEGGDGNDLLEGGADNDELDGNDGDDTLHGGDGDNDTADYFEDIAGVTVNLATGTATDGWGDADTLSNIKNVTGSEFDDTITGNDGNNQLDGGAGIHALTGGAGDDRFVLDTASEFDITSTVSDFQLGSDDNSDTDTIVIDIPDFGDLTDYQRDDIETFKTTVETSGAGSLTITDEDSNNLVLSVAQDGDDTQIEAIYDGVETYTMILTDIDADDLEATHFDFM